MSKYRIILRRGQTEEIATGSDLVTGELCFDMDRDKLVTVNVHGNLIDVSEVVIGPNEGLYFDTPDGYIPLSIKRGG